ncbi:MAG: 1-acyl-sn-glycerol-3-phosphate acyltransferase, partial [Kofleriaceae bacterium]|nr:1-acyl-sn-glycerol-3-phosphate acyltransferase [Kofleriaceae bacterium]
APEGTRSKDGRIGPLKKGGFHLALDTGAPIVPVALSGTGAILPPGAKAMRTGCRVEVEIGAPIAVAGRTVDELRAEVAAFLAAHVAAP